MTDTDDATANDDGRKIVLAMIGAGAIAALIMIALPSLSGATDVMSVVPVVAGIIVVLYGITYPIHRSSPREVMGR